MSKQCRAVNLVWSALLDPFSCDIFLKHHENNYRITIANNRTYSNKALHLEHQRSSYATMQTCSPCKISGKMEPHTQNRTNKQCVIFIPCIHCSSLLQYKRNCPPTTIQPHTYDILIRPNSLLVAFQGQPSQGRLLGRPRPTVGRSPLAPNALISSMDQRALLALHRGSWTGGR